MTDEGALFDLMSWMSPAWPIGAFSYSSGLEWAVEAGHVVDRASCFDWICDLVAHGTLQSDLVVLIHAWRAVTSGDRPRLQDVAELAAAAQVTRERALESTAQGAAFRRIAIDAAPNGKTLADWLSDIEDEDLAYPVAAACLFALGGVSERAAATAFLHGGVSNLVSAAQRLVPLGQTDAQRVLADIRPVILAASDAAQHLPDGDPFERMASASFLADIGCMKHETQYTRLFRT